jgi:putative ABC transport system substrate-binding protein
MRRRNFIRVIGGSVITWPLSGRAQQPDRVRRVGVLHVVPGEASLGFPALRKKLHELGYIEGRNIAFVYRWSDQAPRLPDLAAELTGLRVDVIVTADTATTFVAKKATKDIPIVDDPVATGLVDSLRHPGGNLTGINLLTSDMSGKRLELLREIVPGLKRVAVLWSRQVPQHAVLLRETDHAARDLGIVVVHIEANTAEDIESAFRSLCKSVLMQSTCFWRLSFSHSPADRRSRAQISPTGHRSRGWLRATRRTDQVWTEPHRCLAPSGCLR